MASIIKTEQEIAALREGGPIAARILHELAEVAKPGVTTSELDQAARTLIADAGGSAAFLGYRPQGEATPFPAALCTSVNDEVVHGVPSGYTLKTGDIISIDLGFKYKGVYLDLATTVAVGTVSHEDQNLLAATEEALRIGIEQIVPGARTGDIGSAIESYIKENKLTVITSLSGHGVGRAIHEDPFVPNFGKKGKGEPLVPGMVIAIEPIITRGRDDIEVLDDGYTIITADGAHAAHYEHTVLITETGGEVLTMEK
jgi:methionyl aminopeptidase